MKKLLNFMKKKGQMRGLNIQKKNYQVQIIIRKNIKKLMIFQMYGLTQAVHMHLFQMEKMIKSGQHLFILKEQINTEVGFIHHFQNLVAQEELRLMSPF